MNLPTKEPISDKADGSRTAHLQPVIDFLKAQGNEPATGDAFEYNRDGLGTYGFAQPLDVDLLQQRFDFPPSIHLSSAGLHDSRNFVRIAQDFGPQPVRPLSFEF
ncbi:hypothetical protein [Hymenobacter sp. BT190]|uniref:hypothetical protein n=1 Tax=Hymenobacter sp. BT190 TaxID=2763505 RepID=UPI001650FFF5|nr:hypothetical protein [Hymenobacter sp. BT190]MBC6700169.1 hypothetical protein [Hymenobacter sp. BT190]